jgi:hypothetical protein
LTTVAAHALDQVAEISRSDVDVADAVPPEPLQKKL